MPPLKAAWSQVAINNAARSINSIHHLQRPLESVLLTAVIDAKENRDVAVIDIPNVFVQTRLEDDLDKAIMCLHGKLAELMAKVALESYTKYVIINSKGETVLYVRLLGICAEQLNFL
jgi:hypothetical protein